MATDAIDVDQAVGELRDLARGAVVKAREKLIDAGRPRKHGAELHEHRYWNGYLQGVCAAIATLTGESSDRLVQEFQGVAGAKPWNGF